MNEKFTQGEWMPFYPHELVSSDHITVESENGVFICSTEAFKSNLEEKTANAHLIAAAPEMYRMLERLKPMIEDYDYDLFCERATGEWSEPEISTEIEKLLAKARGQI